MRTRYNVAGGGGGLCVDDSMMWERGPRQECCASDVRARWRKSLFRHLPPDARATGHNSNTLPQTLVRQDTTRLKALKVFADGVFVASLAANRPTEDRYSISEFEPTKGRLIQRERR